MLFFGTLNEVLNLVINGIPSILLNFKWGEPGEKVLNLVINGIPSIPVEDNNIVTLSVEGFKPCYKWNTFNTIQLFLGASQVASVLNLVINGIPSIQDWNNIKKSNL